MIHNIYGVPGSGKTYWAVNYIITHFCNYDEFNKTYRIKDDTVLITNIEGLKVNHLQLEKLFKEMGFDKVFSEDYFRFLKKKYKNVVFIIDEAQKVFSTNTYNKVKYAFEYHRHLGIEIICLSQRHTLLPPALSALCEYIIKAMPRSKTLDTKYLSVFKYNYYDPEDHREPIFSKTLKVNKNVFKVYKSFEFDETSKPINALKPLFIMGLVGILLLGFAVYRFKATFLNAQPLSSTQIANNARPRAHPQKNPLTDPAVVDTKSPSVPRSGQRTSYIYPTKGHFVVDNELQYILDHGLIYKERGLSNCFYQPEFKQILCRKPLIINGSEFVASINDDENIRGHVNIIKTESYEKIEIDNPERDAKFVGTSNPYDDNFRTTGLY